MATFTTNPARLATYKGSNFINCRIWELYRNELVSVKNTESEPLKDEREDGELESGRDIFRRTHRDRSLLELE